MSDSAGYQTATVAQLAERLLRAHERGEKAAVFLGAGASKSAGIPLADELVAEIAQKYPQNVAGEVPAYSAYMRRLTHSERDDLMRPYVQSAKTTATYLCLANLVRQRLVDVVLSVNFDWLVEQGLGHTNVRPYVYDMADSQHYQQGRIRPPAVIYLHGRFGGFNNVHTDDGMRKIQSRVTAVLKEQLSNRIVIVVGYSGLVDPVFETLCAEFASFDHGLYWVTPDTAPPSHVLKGLLAEPDRQSYLLGSVDSDTFFAQIESAMGMPPLPILSDPLAHMRSTLDQIDDAVSAPVRIKIDRLTEVPVTTHAAPAAGVRRTKPDDLRATAAAAWETQDYAALAELAPFALTSEDEVARQYVSWGVYNRATGRAEAALQKPGPERHTELLVARDEMKMALQVFPSLAEGYINLGLVLSYLSKSEHINQAERDAFRREAESQFELAVDRAPAWAGPFDGLASVVTDMARTSVDKSERLALLLRASNLYWRAVYNHKDDHRALNNWGIVLKEIAALTEGSVAQEAYDRACEKFRRATLISPDSPNAYYNWGLTLHVRASRSSPDDRYVLLNDASDKYAVAVRLAPARVEPAYNRGVVLMEIERLGALPREGRCDLLAQAGEMFRLSTETNPDLYEGFYNWGNAMVRRYDLMGRAAQTADIESAVANLTRATSLRPDSVEAHNNLGVALALHATRANLAEEKLRLYLNALEEYRLARDLEPGEVKTTRALANALQHFGRLQAPGDSRATFTESLGLYRELLGAQTDEPGLHAECSNVWLGLVHAETGQERINAISEAKLHAKRAEELRRGAGAYNLACASALAGGLDEAFGLLETALQLTEETRAHIDADPDLDSLKGDKRWPLLLDKYRPI